jgi:methyl-accepting chemotaxis protein
MNNQNAEITVNIPLSRSLFGKLLFFLLLIGLVPVILNAGFGYMKFQQGLVDSAVASQEIFEQDQSDFLLSWAAERTQDIQTLAGVARIASLNPETADVAIQQYYKMWGVYETIFLTGPDGKSIVTSNGKPLDVFDRQYFKEAISGKAAFSEALVSRASGNVVIVVAAPIFAKEQVIGVIGATVTLEKIAELLSHNKTGETSDSYLINSSGYVVTAPRFSAEMKNAGMYTLRPELEAKLDTFASQQIQKGVTGSSTYLNYLGKEVIGQYTWLPDLKIGLISEKQSSEIKATSQGLAVFSVILILISAVVILVLAFLIARSITNPVKLIAQSANRLAIGDINHTFEYQSRDEYGLLSDAFRRMITYQKEMTDLAVSISEGDLTRDAQPKSERDTLGQAFRRMVQNLRGSIGQVSQSATDLNQASGQLVMTASQAAQATSQIAVTVQQVAKGITQETDSISKTAHSVEQMARAIDGVAHGAQDQNRSVTKAVEITNGLSQTIEQVAGNAQSVTRDSAGAAEAARLGARTVAETIKGMERIKEKVSLSAQAVTEMGARSDQIGTIVETIEDIASQTNLLALNAAIEAARAGEHGKGFAVVADEVRKLAERAAGATREIGGLIKDIQKTVAGAVNSMEEGGREVENGVRLASESGQALAAILKAAEEVYRQAEQAGKGAAQMSAASTQLVGAVDGFSAVVEENTAATEELTAGTHEVTRSIENIAAVSEQNSASMEQVSASTEEISAQVDEVTSSARKLSEMARNLQAAVAQFKL